MEDSEQNLAYEGDTRINALNLKWTLGFNFESIDSVHNLTNDTRKEIFYVVGHTGVIYDYENNSQRLLQGHCNKIYCTDYNRQEDIIVTADVGADSMLVVWDAKHGTPRKTIFDPHPFGTQSLAISPDGKFIATLSIDPNQDITKQIITLWEWEADQPSKINENLDFKDDKGQPQPYEHGNAYQSYIRFNPDNLYELVTTGKNYIIFWSWEAIDKGFEYYMPEKKGNSLTQTVFIPQGTQAVSGTVDGFIIVWDISLIMEDYSQPEERRQIKKVNLMNTAKKSENSSKKEPASINILKIEGQNLVIGSSTGSIRFYDFQYRIIAWFEDIDIGSITNISFADMELEEDQDMLEVGDGIETDQKFVCPPFIVVDKEAKITKLDAGLFDQIDKEKKRGEELMKSIVSPIVDISVRPNSNTIAICCQNGSLFQWNFEEKSQILKELRIFQEFPKCIDYSPNYLDSGDNNKAISFLAVATGRKQNKSLDKDKQNLQNQPSGKIHIYNLKTETWQAQSLDITVQDANKPIVEQQQFSSNSKYLACIDSDYAVTLFCYDYRTWEYGQDKEWQCAGKHRVHHAKIRSLSFGETEIAGKRYYKLFTIAEDMRMCEFNIIEIPDAEYINPTENTNFVKRLELRSVFQIEQESIPTACCWYPINMLKEDTLLTVNDSYKIKLWSFDEDRKERERELKEKDNKNYQKPINKNFNIICKKTVLGPTYGGAIEKLLVLNQNDAQSEYQDKYLAYATKEKVVGIIKLPLEGNPNQTMGLIAHADKITGISATNDGKYFFTSGSDDFAVNIFGVNMQALEEAFYTNPNEDPYPALLEGGEGGQTHQDLKDFFYYSQIRSKDENSTKARKLDGKVPLIAIEDMMRSLGYYPTNQEIENMQNEVKRSQQSENKEFVDELDLKMFLKLFVNHRPVYGISKQQIQEVLDTITYDNTTKESTKTLTSKELRDILQTEGEPLTNEEWDLAMKNLMGEEQYMPENINADNLCDDILGFEDLEDGQEDEEGDEEYEGEDDEEISDA